MNMQRWRTGIGVMLMLMHTLLWAENMPTTVVEKKSYPLSYEFDGVVEAINRATVSSHIAAEVIEINYDVNDHVPKDAVILRFKDDEIKTRLMRAEANLLAERAQYQEAVARQQEAQAEADRIKDLFARKQVTRSARDKAEADRAAANARVNVLSAQIKARQAEVDEAKVALSYTVIKAPYAGIVTKRLIELGEMASPGQVLMSGISLDALRVVIQIPQRLLNELLPTNTVQVKTFDEKPLNTGEITLVPQADPNTHAFELRISLSGNNSMLYPGTSVKVMLPGENEKVLVVPARTMVQRGEVSGVYVLKNDKVSFRQIRKGRQPEPDWVEVLSGLNAGEQIVTEPAQAIRKMKQDHD